MLNQLIRTVDIILENSKSWLKIAYSCQIARNVNL